ncbi:MAG TPA: hypothetical protein VN048_19685 [Verrucomicrobiae bacterium]|jgi:hypothetical protein|nr:hypothetical protein [Verrucomicrobiae bacterium]
MAGGLGAGTGAGMTGAAGGGVAFTGAAGALKAWSKASRALAWASESGLWA